MSSNAKTDPRHDFLPARDVDLVAWSRNFRDFIVADAPQLGLTQQQADEYSILNDAFADGYAAANNPSTNSKSAIVAKNTAKKALKAEARALARIVQATPSVTDAQRAQLGLTVADAAGARLTPGTQPNSSPTITVLPTLGRKARIRLRDKASPDRLGRPLGVAGAIVMTYVAQSAEDQPPADPRRWSLSGIATRRFFDVSIAADVPVSSQMWIAAMWFNARGEFGPPSTPESIRVGDGVAKLRMAA